MKTEMPGPLHPILVTYQTSADPSERSAKVAFKSLKSKLGKRYHHNPHIRDVYNSRATGGVIMCCPAV